ncbi:hypothetical protein DAPPUDRAFT_270389 [Daphnia pulex]|uniref:Uncharacterized protein n=1 Tax=Daphnia pulex TaxID=6669 RepID=E9I0M4_DAPPU|nr:hypothetical protein DAPPUDRAFT_270389 [Daphnia pulex]|eukprot:EFX62456.1 hypothetical protein DAPPUDRAFT_270389 [Daphnia pulex]
MVRYWENNKNHSLGKQQNNLTATLTQQNIEDFPARKRGQTINKNKKIDSLRKEKIGKIFVVFPEEEATFIVHLHLLNTILEEFVILGETGIQSQGTCEMMDWLLNLESYNIDLNDIHFMFAGLELTKSGVIPEMTIS